MKTDSSEVLPQAPSPMMTSFLFGVMSDVVLCAMCLVEYTSSSPSCLVVTWLLLLSLPSYAQQNLARLNGLSDDWCLPTNDADEALIDWTAN